MGWFKRWSNFDSARSLADLLSGWVLTLFGTTLAAVIAAAAAYTQWYWDSYGPIGVAFAFLVSAIVLPLAGVFTAGTVLLFAYAKQLFAAAHSSDAGAQTLAKAPDDHPNGGQ